MFIAFGSVPAVQSKARQILKVNGVDPEYMSDRDLEKRFLGLTPSMLKNILPLLVDFYTTVRKNDSSTLRLQMVLCDRTTAKTLVYSRTNKRPTHSEWVLINNVKDIHRRAISLTEETGSAKFEFNGLTLKNGELESPVLVAHKLSTRKSESKLVQVVQVFCLDLKSAKSLVYYQKNSLTHYRKNPYRPRGLLTEHAKDLISGMVRKMLAEGKSPAETISKIKEFFNGDDNHVGYATEVARNVWFNDEVKSDKLRFKDRKPMKYVGKIVRASVGGRIMKKVKEEGDEDDIQF